MKRTFLLIALLGPLVPMADAGELSACVAACNDQRQQCTRQASRMVELDNPPTVQDTNPMGIGQITPASERAAARVAKQRRSQERIDACEPRYLRCNRDCASAAVRPAGQASPVK